MGSENSGKEHLIKWIAILIFSIFFVLLFRVEISSILKRATSIKTPIFEVVSTPLGDFENFTKFQSPGNESGANPKQNDSWDIKNKTYFNYEWGYKISWPNSDWNTNFDDSWASDMLNTIDIGYRKIGYQSSFLAVKNNDEKGLNTWVSVAHKVNLKGESLKSVVHKFKENVRDSKWITEEIDDITQTAILVYFVDSTKKYTIVKLARTENFIYQIIGNVGAGNNLKELKLNEVFNSFTILGN